jgi:hypothetical protein
MPGIQLVTHCSALPVGRLDGRVEQEGKDPWKLDREVRGKTARDPTRARLVDDVIKLVLEMSTGDRDPVRRNESTVASIADTQPMLKNLLNPRCKCPVTVILDQQPTSSEQMSQTRLMHGVRESAVRRPAIAHENTRKLGAEDRGRFFKAAPGLNRVHRRVRGRKAPQPLQMPPNFPTRFIGRDDWAAANRLAQRPVGRFRVSRRAAHRVDESTSGDRQPEALAEQRRDLAERQSELLVEHHGEHDSSEPSCAAAAPSASDVCSGWRPCTRRPHARQWPMATTNARTIGRTTGRSS